MEKDKSQIQDLFNNISKRYDLLNSLLSLGMDRFWRSKAIARMPDKGPYLDLCAGTLELTLLLLKERKRYHFITSLDFCLAMLKEGKKKIDALHSHSSGPSVFIIEGDGERLPLKDNLYKGVIIGFGLRNISDKRAGLREILRVLIPGGKLVVLDFSRPVNPIFRQLYYLYFCHILPPVGNIISRGGDAYNHLRDSVIGFPDQDKLALMIRDAGFVDAGYQNLTCGIVAVHWGKKPDKPSCRLNGTTNHEN